ncbi:MAG: LytTR family transcriptional regulator [Marinilabiliales bacterium]|nr:LytTR family transcriptional regulator [Marinilabiliales bacterium]
MFENLNQPYRFNNNFKHNAKTILLVSMGFILIVLYIQPLGINFLKSEHDGYFVLGAGLFTAAILFFNTLILPGIFTKMFNPERWTIKKELIWNFWMFVNLFFGLTFLAWIARMAEYTDLPFFRTGALALLPLVLFNLISYNLSLKLKVMNMIDSGKIWLKEEINALQSGGPTSESVHLVAENRKQAFAEEVERVILIHSSGNYVEIVWIDRKQMVRRRLFRQSFTNVEKALVQSDVMLKCHRCWMVNLNKVRRLKRSTSGYILEMEGLDYPVPVSRNHISLFKEKLI